MAIYLAELVADVEQLEAMGSVDVPVAVAADNRQGNDNENRNGVNDVEDATVINDKDEHDDDIDHNDDDDDDNDVSGSSTAQIDN